VTGYGVIDVQGNKNFHVAHGTIRTETEAFPLRLGKIFAGITEVIQTWQPQEVSIEEVFVAKNAASALKLGQARGAAICAAVQAGCPVFEYTAKLIKQSVVGKGAAEKHQVQHMVKIMLNLHQDMPHDASDGLAIALTHAHLHATQKRLQGGTSW